MGAEDFRAALDEQQQTPRTLDFRGESFALASSTSAITVLSVNANAGISLDSPEGARAVLDFAEDCFTPESWPLFRACVRRHKLDMDEFTDLVAEANQIITGRPTKPSSSSEDGSSSTSPPSTGSSAPAASGPVSSG
jgi:hypothetical protein